jgi:23S rRNA pseudouridine1911/1915/1917 synthase
MKEGIFISFKVVVKTLTVLYEDNHLLAVEKPAGLLIQGDKTGDPTLLEQAKAWLKIKYNKRGEVYLGLVHRLDRPVAGVVIFAKTSKAAKRLCAQFQERTVNKIYRAVVEGIPDEPSGTLFHYLLKDEETGRAKLFAKQVPGSKPAELQYRALKSVADKAEIEVRLITGRSHQIRAQLSRIGFPILGDVKYGAKTELSECRIALFAERLTFSHPVKGEKITVEVPLPLWWLQLGP